MSRYALEIPGYGQQSIWGYDPMTGDLFAQLWQNGSSSDNPETWIIEQDLESFYVRIAMSFEPMRDFDEVFFTLAEQGPPEGRLQMLFAAFISQSSDPRFVQRAARSPEQWVRLEAQHNPYYEPTQPEPAHPGQDAQPEQRKSSGWWSRLFGR